VHRGVTGEAPPKLADAVRQAALGQPGKQQTRHSCTFPRTSFRGPTLFRWLSG